MIEKAWYHWIGRYGGDLDTPMSGIPLPTPKPTQPPAAVKLETPKGIFNRPPTPKARLLVIDNHEFETVAGDDLSVGDVFSVKGKPGTFNVSFRTESHIATSQGKVFKVAEIPNVLRKKRPPTMYDTVVMAITGEKPPAKIVDYRPYIVKPTASDEERTAVRKSIFRAIQDGILTADEANQLFDQHTLSILQSEPAPKGVELLCLA